MNKVKLLITVSVVLLLVNIGLLVFLFSHRPNKRGDGPRNYIIEKLNFDKAQIKEYDYLIKSHRTQISELDQKVKELKNQMYSNLLKSSSYEQDSLIKEISKTQVQIENTHLQHFNAVYRLCKPNQSDNFNDLLLEMSKLFSGPRKERN